MKIGFLEKWNKEANCKEFSITRLQMAVFTLFAMFFIYQFFVTEGNPVTVNSIVLTLTILAGAYTPKAIKDFYELKDKAK